MLAHCIPQAGEGNTGTGAILLSAILALLISWTPAQAADFTGKVLDRSFLVHVPDSSAAGQRPAVLVLHGGGGNAAQVRQQTGMDATADKYGFIAVYPEGTGGALSHTMETWNAGLCCGAAARRQVDDVAFISAVIDKIAADYGADPKRIYVTGHSNGGMMSYRLACELSGKIAAIAPNAGDEMIDSCHPARPVPVLHIHGLDDPCVPFKGGEQCGGCFSKLLGLRLPNDTWPCTPIEDVVAEHARMNGCSDKTQTVYTKGAAACIRYEGCSAPVGLCTIAGAGHSWPGSEATGSLSCQKNPNGGMCKKWRERVGPSTRDLDANEVIWSFFRDLRLP